MFLASPVTGGGIAAARFHQLFLLALRQGRESADDLARFAWDMLAAQGQRMVKDNKPLETEADNLTELAAQAREFIDQAAAGPARASDRLRPTNPAAGGHPPMKIASLETGIVLLPNDEPLAGFSENPNAQEPDRLAAAAHR